MDSFDPLYINTVTLFNRVKGKYGEEELWYPTILEGVHLITDKSSSWNNYGGQATDNARLHVRYKVQNGNVIVAGKPWYEPKAWRRLANPEEAITFRFGNNDDFDFFVAGALTEFDGPVSDSLYERGGFYNHMNGYYDNVFVISSVSKYDLIRHFEITAR